jgi:hypothetical protein
LRIFKTQEATLNVPKEASETKIRKLFLFPKSVLEGLGKLFFEKPQCVEGHVQDSFVVLIRPFVALMHSFVVLLHSFVVLIRVSPWIIKILRVTKF